MSFSSWTRLVNWRFRRKQFSFIHARSLSVSVHFNLSPKPLSMCYFSHEDCTNGSGDGGCLSFRCPVVSMVLASSDATVSHVILSLAATTAASHCAEPWMPWLDG